MAKLDKASDYGSEDCGFEFCWARHLHLKLFYIPITAKYNSIECKKALFRLYRDKKSLSQFTNRYSKIFSEYSPIARMLHTLVRQTDQLLHASE